MPKIWPFLLSLLCVGGLAQPAAAEREAWTARYPEIVAGVQAGQPLTLLVVVALCDSALIACGGQGAGDPGSLDKNLYWGRAFGARRFFDEAGKKRGWQRVAQQTGAGPMLEQLVYRRYVDGKRWRDDSDAPARVEQLVVLRAIHGRNIDDAVRDLYRYAGSGAQVEFLENERTRRVPVHVVGYAGHNRLTDGVTIAPPAPVPSSALPSFVFACRSQSYFSDTLSALGSQPLVMTRDLMAPEGYIIESLARGLADHESRPELRDRVIKTYAAWQRIPERTARAVFAR